MLSAKTPTNVKKLKIQSNEGGIRMNNELLRYSLQLSMLSLLLSKQLLNNIEYKKIKIKLMKKYNISTELYL